MVRFSLFLSRMAEVLLHQRGGGRVEALNGSTRSASSLQLLAHVLCEHFSQLHTPLVEAIEAPDETFHRGSMLVQCKQLTTGERVQSWKQEGKGRTVARELLLSHNNQS